MSVLPYRVGMELIESRDVEGFTGYLKKFKNTICGRHPIGVFLNVLRHCQKDYKVLFTRYEQSSVRRVQVDISLTPC